MKQRILFSLTLACSFVACSQVFAQVSQDSKAGALKAIDPSQVQYDTPPLAPDTTSFRRNPANAFNQINGQPLEGRRTLGNPNPQGAYFPGNNLPPRQMNPQFNGYGAPPLQPNMVQYNATPYIDDRRIARLEQMVFGSNYPEHDIEDRINHLETEIFGRKTINQPLGQRLAVLESKLGTSGAFGGTANNPNSMRPPVQLVPPIPAMQNPAYNRNMGQLPPQQMPMQNSGYNPNFVVQQQAQQPPQQQMPRQSPVYNPSFAGQQPMQNPGYNPNFVAQQQVQQPPVAPSRPQVAEPNLPILPNLSAQEQALEQIELKPAPVEESPKDSLASVSSVAPEAQAVAQDSSANTNSYEAVLKAIPSKPAAGDYFPNISRFSKGVTARWTSFPVTIHLPEGAPEAWRKSLEEAIAKWNKYIPVHIAQVSEPADIELGWINHLNPGQLGLTNLEIFNGRIRVTIYLLRPTYYLPSTPEKALNQVALHEIGHALGLFGHSSEPSDLMYPLETPSGKDLMRTKFSGISARDLNTLKRVYEAPALPPGFQSAHPMGWP